MVQEFDNEGKLAKNPAQNTSNWQTFELLNSKKLLSQLVHCHSRLMDELYNKRNVAF